MRRSRTIRLVLLGSLSAGALAGCDPAAPPSGLSVVYTNNHHIPGLGYYHAPFRAWYSLPYNHYDPGTARYYYGGQWGPSPYESVVNISPPTADALQQLRSAQGTSVRRGGFGSTGRHTSYFS